jgi:hypothetical protein
MVGDLKKALAVCLALSVLPISAPILSPTSDRTSTASLSTFTTQAFAVRAIPFTRQAYQRVLFSYWVMALRLGWGDDNRQTILWVATKWFAVHLVASLGYYLLTDDWATHYPEWLLPALVPIGFIEALVSWRIEQRIEKTPVATDIPEERVSLTIPYAIGYIIYVSVVEGALYEWLLPHVPTVWMRTVIDILFLSPLVMDPLAALILHRMGGRNQDEAMMEIEERLPFFFVATSPVWGTVSYFVNRYSPTNPILSYLILSFGIVIWCTIFALSNRINLYQLTQRTYGLRWYGRVAMFFSLPLKAIYKARKRYFDFSRYLQFIGAALPAVIISQQAWLFHGGLISFVAGALIFVAAGDLLRNDDSFYTPRRIRAAV